MADIAGDEQTVLGSEAGKGKSNLGTTKGAGNGAGLSIPRYKPLFVVASREASGGQNEAIDKRRCIFTRRSGRAHRRSRTVMVVGNGEPIFRVAPKKNNPIFVTLQGLGHAANLRSSSALQVGGECARARERRARRGRVSVKVSEVSEVSARVRGKVSAVKSGTGWASRT